MENLLPLEQFKIFKIIKHYNSWVLHITNNRYFIMLGLTLIIIILYYNIYNSKIISKYLSIIFEKIYFFILNLVSENIKTKDFKFFIYIFNIFIILLLFNLIGMIPYSFTITSHIIITLTLSFISFLGLNIIGIIKNGFLFLNLFLPKGSPIAMSPFLIMIEIISYIARVFSLAIWLFANMTSGHTLLRILSAFGWALISFNITAIISIAPIFIVFLVTGLEISIAILQAYVFTILICIYINDAYNLH